MQYMGGKHRLAKHIAEAIAHYRRGRTYLEPFVGGGHVLERVPQEEGRLAGDANTALIMLYRALLSGWEPPGELSKETWLRLKAQQNPHDPSTAFAGIGCSFMGMWFGGYTDRAARTRRVLLRQRELFRGTLFFPGGYDTFDPQDCLVYCDPPYQGTEGYPAVPGAFNYSKYYGHLRQWIRRGCTILASEYSMPPDFECIAEWPINGKMKRGGRATERLFLLGG